MRESAQPFSITLKFNSRTDRGTLAWPDCGYPQCFWECLKSLPPAAVGAGERHEPTLQDHRMNLLDALTHRKFPPITQQYDARDTVDLQSSAIVLRTRRLDHEVQVDLGGSHH